MARIHAISQTCTFARLRLCECYRYVDLSASPVGSVVVDGGDVVGVVVEVVGRGVVARIVVVGVNIVVVVVVTLSSGTVVSPSPCYSIVKY